MGQACVKLWKGRQINAFVLKCLCLCYEISTNWLRIGYELPKNKRHLESVLKWLCLCYEISTNWLRIGYELQIGNRQSNVKCC